MRALFTSLFAASVLSACAHAGETSAPKPKAASSHAALYSDYRVYIASADSMADVDAAIKRAQRAGTKAMIVMGANWCHDSRGFAARLDRPEFKALIAQYYELVYVNAGGKPGQKNQNRTISKRFGVDQIEGTPTIFIVRGDGTVINADSAGYWRRAASIPTDMSYAYFDMYAKK